MESRSRNKIIIILGPTSSGKSEVAIRLAQKFKGEIVSADSRQIYRGMDLGTGKVTKFEQKLVKHHMLDIVSPKTNYNVAKYKKLAEKIITDILKRGKVPIICGGTGFWIKALVDNVDFPEVKPNLELRKRLEKESAENLFKKLLKLDPERAKDIDAKNKVRLIRAIEICQKLGSVPKIKSCHPELVSGSTEMPKQVQHDKYNFLQIGIDLPKEKLHKNIEQRLEARFKKGMIQEVKNLHFKFGVSWKKLDLFGLEYRYISQFLQNKLSKDEMKNKLFQESKDYAKRQLTWFKKDSRILWLKNYSAIEKSVQKFLH